MQLHAVRLRPEIASDDELLLACYAATREVELSLANWSPEERQNFVRSQFNLQRSHYHKHYQNAEFNVIMHGEDAIGRVYTQIGKSELRLMEITLLPKWQQKGIGSFLLDNIEACAEEAGVPVTLHVEPFIPACKWYQKRGYHKLEERGIYWLMSRPNRPSLNAGNAHLG